MSWCVAPLYGPAEAAAPLSDVDIQVVDAATLDLFLDTLNRGFGVPPDHLAGIRANQCFWIEADPWRLYLARTEGEVAGAAVLARTDEHGHLAVASTLPRYRRRGVHAAVLARRIVDARALGCAWVCGEATAGSTSQANMQRAGLQIAHTKTIWSDVSTGES